MAHEVLDAAAVLERDLLLVIGALVDEADLETRLRNAIICRRSSTVCARKSVSSKTVASGQNVTVVPVRPRGALPVTSSLPCG